MRPSATEHVQQLSAILLYILESNKIKKKKHIKRLLWFTVHFSFLFLSPYPPSFICYIMPQILTLISLFTYIIQNARDIIWLAHYIILCKCLHQQISIWMLFNIDYYYSDITAQACVIFETSALLLEFLLIIIVKFGIMAKTDCVSESWLYILWELWDGGRWVLSYSMFIFIKSNRSCSIISSHSASLFW